MTGPVRTRAAGGRWRAWLPRNAGRKVAAFVVACLVWYATNVLERDAERVVEMPLVTRHVPPELVLVDEPTAPVLVTIRGPRTLLEGVEGTRARFVLPVRKLTAGTNRLELQAGRVEPTLPRRIRVVRVHPGRVELRTEPLRRRRLPVRVELAGSPAFGYSIAESRVMPEEIEVAGPASVIDELKAVQTVPIDLRGLDASTTRSVALDWAGDHLSFEPDRVTVTARVEEVVVTRRFPRVAVQLDGPPGATVTPATLAVTLRGPERLLHNYEIPAGVAWIDATTLPAGTHRVEATVEVPADFEVVARKPDVHSVHVPAAEDPS